MGKRGPVFRARGGGPALLALLALLGLFGLPGLLGGAARGGEYEFLASSFVGGTGDDDSVTGARIQSDGTIVLAATIAPDAKLGPKPNGDPAKRGAVIRVSPDGRKVLSVVRLADELKDMDVDDRDCIYLAAGAAGVVKLDTDARKVLWRKAVGGDCSRVAAGRDGHSVALAGDTGTIFDPSGRELSKVKSGRQFTEDCCIDSESKTAVLIGFRNASAFDGKRTYPVQICYLFGYAYPGERKWSAYDWSTDRDSDRFLNKPENNMADTRGYRCSIGRDGKLYAAFEAAGGNHCFRYSSVDIMKKVAMAGGDAHHSFHNSRAEHKTVFVRMEPGTGEYLAGQQFCARLTNGRANAARVKTGDITADEHGRVCLTGSSAYGLPITFQPPGVGEYKGGAYVLVMSPDLKQRLLCTRLQAGGGEPQAVSGRVIGEKAVLVFAGGKLKVDKDGKLEPYFALEPFQGENAGPDGYFALAAMPDVGPVPEELRAGPR